MIPHYSCDQVEEAVARIARIGEERDSFPFDIDGAVVKVNDLSERELLGSTAKFPAGRRPTSTPPEVKPSRVVDITVQVGRTGVLTPKAVLEPVRLAGTTVTSATLPQPGLHHGEGHPRRGHGAGPKGGGDHPGGAVRGGGGAAGRHPALPLPPGLPGVRRPVEREEDGAHIRCTGAECPAQLLRNLAHFASRDAMDIEGLGIAVVENLVNAGLVKTPRRPVLPEGGGRAQLERMGKKSAENLMAAIQRSKEQDLSRLIYAFGIRQVGQKAGKVLAARFGTLEALENATLEELTAVDDIGEITARSVLEWMASPQSRHLMARLREAGVNTAAAEKGEDQRFAGMTFVLTGALERLTREEAAAMIEGRGAKRPPPCPRRPPMWWRGRLPAPSCARPRSWASRCSARRNFSGSWSEWRGSRAFGELDRLDWSGGASALPLGVFPGRGGRGREEERGRVPHGDEGPAGSGSTGTEQERDRPKAVPLFAGRDGGISPAPSCGRRSARRHCPPGTR